MLLAAAILAQLATPDRVAVDAVAAVVERRVITTSEVQAEARLVLLDRAGVDVAVGELHPALLQKLLDAMVLQELLALEARRTGVVVREADIDASVAAVRARFSDADGARLFLQRFGIDDELLRGRARRDLAAQTLLARALVGTSATDDEARALMASDPQVTDLAAARERLDEQRREARFASLVADLKKSVEVRVVWRP